MDYLPATGLGQEERKLLGLAAFLKDIGSLDFPEEKARMSREILLTHPLKGLKTPRNSNACPDC